MSSGWNYPAGVDGSSDYFNEPNPPTCENKKCGAQLETDWSWCPFCGTRIDGDDEMTEKRDSIVGTVEVDAPFIDHNMIYCGYWKCGAELDPDWEWCPYCGLPTNQEETMPL